MFRKNKQEPQEILELFAKRPTVIKPGLSRIESALKILGYPSKSTPKIIVGGTNGKGSTCGMIWRLLAAAGLRVGLFTSPHLQEFRERISISDREVSNAEIIEAIHELRTRTPENLWKDLTFFEINTILAFMIFEQQKTDVNVLEVGLGGRFDCVNVYDADVSVITSIGLDHVEFLGDSLEKIASEKSGIMRKHKPCIWGGLVSSSDAAHQVILQASKEINAELIDASKLSLEFVPQRIKDRPKFLQRNFVIASEAVNQFLKMGLVSRMLQVNLRDLLEHYDDDQLPWPVTFNGRFDLVRVSNGSVSIKVMVDVCHNPHGAKALAEALNETRLAHKNLKRNCLISVLEDKDVAGIWNEIKDNIAQTIKFRINSPRSWRASDDRIDAKIYDSFSEAWNFAVQDSEWIANQPWLIFGSVAAVGEVFKFWRVNEWKIERLAIS